MEPSDPYNSYSFRYKIHLYLLPFTKVNANNPAIKKSRKAVALIIFGRQIHKPEEGYRSTSETWRLLYLNHQKQLKRF